MRFRSIVLLTVVGLVVAIVVATVAAVAAVIDRSARSTLAEALTHGQHVFEDLLTYRESLFRAQVHLMAEEPRLKAVVDTQDVNRETVLGVSLDVKKALQSDLFLVTDATGHLIADVADPEASGYDLSGKPVVAAALAKGDATDVWTREQHAYQVLAHRLTFGATTVGVLIIGYELNDQVAETIYRQTGDSVVVQLGDVPIAVAGFVSSVGHPGLAAALRPVIDAEGPREVSFAGTRWLSQSQLFPGRSDTEAARKTPMRYTLLRSLDEARAPVTRITRLLYAIAGLALLLAVAFTARLSSRLSRPIDALVRFTEEVGAGHLDGKVRTDGPVEIQTLGKAMNHMVAELDSSRRRLADQERMRRELEIATRIQTAMLPAQVNVEGLEVAARMIPAEDVGGDYYDVLPFPGGAWFAIGDVAGHGLTAGLVMMMIQSIVAALVTERPDASPTEILNVLNHTLYDNIRVRLSQDEHVTLTLFRYDVAGNLAYAGAHEELLVCRQTGGPCERLPTPGTWLGAVPDIAASTVESKLSLRDGDLLALYTDGVIQAMDQSGEQFGMERFCEIIEAARHLPVEEIRDRVVQAVTAFQHEQFDDLTLLLLRYRPRQSA